METFAKKLKFVIISGADVDAHGVPEKCSLVFLVSVTLILLRFVARQHLNGYFFANFRCLLLLAA